MAEEALEETRKDHMPLLKFIGTIGYEIMSYSEACTKVVFDFAKSLEEDLDDMDEIVLVKASIKNVGKGIVIGIKINDFYVCPENEISFEKNAYSADVLECFGKEESQNFLLIEEETQDIYFTIPGYDVEEFFQKYDSFFLSLELEIVSTTKSMYEQKCLTAVVNGGDVVKNSFDNIRKSNA